MPSERAFATVARCLCTYGTRAGPATLGDDGRHQRSELSHDQAPLSALLQSWLAQLGTVRYVATLSGRQMHLVTATAVSQPCRRRRPLVLDQVEWDRVGTGPGRTGRSQDAAVILARARPPVPTVPIRLRPGPGRGAADGDMAAKRYCWSAWKTVSTRRGGQCVCIQRSSQTETAFCRPRCRVGTALGWSCRKLEGVPTHPGGANSEGSLPLPARTGGAGCSIRLPVLCGSDCLGHRRRFAGLVLAAWTLQSRLYDGSDALHLALAHGALLGFINAHRDSDRWS